ncbi:MAG: outer membrane protein assembly factor BamA [Candidatus Latescibacteria bacterium]|nr:outer membrane protein assembly factor BamA [Candidatus Latescibacterota bacterium]
MKSFLLILIIFMIQGFDAQAQVRDQVIKEIRVRGNSYTETSLIQGQSGLYEGQRLGSEDAGRAIRNLFKMGLFGDVKIFVDSDVVGGVAVEIVVIEYPQLGTVKFDGNKALKDKKLKRELGFIKAQMIKPQQMKRATNKLVELYKDKGFLLAKVEVEPESYDEDGYIPLTFTIDEGRKVNLKKIRFHGDDEFKNSQLRKQMKETKQDGWWFGGGKYKEEDYEIDKESLLAFYRQNGYREADVVSDSLSYGPNKRDMYLDITIDKGPLYRFGKVSWLGNEKLTDLGVASLVVVDSGGVYSEERLFKTEEQLKNAYMDIGYIGAQIFPNEKERDDHVVDLHFDVIENDPWKIRKILITGNTKTKDRVIRRELRVWPGQTFSRALLERSMREVMALNFFSNVIPTPIPIESSSEIDLEFVVEEKSTGTASVGAGYSERDKLVGTIGLQIPNFKGNGQQVDFQWEFGTQRETFRVGFTEPWFRNTPTSVSVSLFHDTQRFSASGAANFDQQTRGGGFRIGRRLRWPDYSRASVGYRLEDVRFINFSDSTTTQTGSLSNNVTSSISANFTRDSRDLPQFPTSGSVISYTPALAGGFLAGNRDFHKHELVTSFYFPLFWKVALNMRSQLGIVASYGSESVPFNELYTPGGVDLFTGSMLRGYPDQSVGPQNKGGQIGGVTQLLFNAEVSIPIVANQFYGLIFADAGNAWDDLQKISTADLRRSFGFGIRIVAPVVGIMGFDFAWGIDRRRVDGQPVQMITHFQFGPQFF